MGVLNSCWETLLKVAALAHVIEFDLGQQPLPLPGAGSESNRPHTKGISFKPQNATRGDFSCQYPHLGSDWEPCNSANDRSCWLKNSKSGEKYDIHTNYEATFPVGVQREYWLEVEATAITADGYVKESGLTFNGTYPGPVIEACWGDTVVIHVTNKIIDNGTTIHWHGIRQSGSNQMDGVNGVTQCPIALNHTYTYNFQIEQYGHTWYHSHYQLQYSDGVAGPLTIYGPSSANFDEAFQPALITDWTHDSADDLFFQELHGGIPIMDNIIFNGSGNFLCSNGDPNCCRGCSVSAGPGKCTPNPHCFDKGANFNGNRFTAAVKKGKRYLLRLINASSESMFIFSIDGHELEVIATDLVPIHPYKTDSVFLGIGQRYQVILHAKSDEAELNATGGNYWIRTRTATGCGNIRQDDETTGVLNYETFALNPSPTTHTQQFRTDCEDEPREKLNPVLPWQPRKDQIVNNITRFTFEAGIAPPDNVVTDSGYARWDLTNNPLFLNYSDPSIVHADNIDFGFPSSYAIVDYNFTRGYVWLVITGQNLNDSLHRDKAEIPAAHPIHLHGHDFVILAQEQKSFNESTDVPNFNFDNPPRRDVAMLPASGYLALAFKPDNPGIWLVHCHIAFHAASGLALQIMERESEIIGHIHGESALDPVKQGCKTWEEWGLVYHQLDSGI
jgi:FtsP/CotA-like multicopper oxidase with cupredoxin domain